MSLYWKFQWTFFKGWEYCNCLWTNSDGFYFNMKVLWHLFEKIVKFCVMGWGYYIYKWCTFHIISIFLQLVFSLPTYKPKPNEHFLKHSYTSILKGNRRKTQYLIIYKRQMHMYKMSSTLKLQIWIYRSVSRVATIYCYVMPHPH